MPRIVNVDSLSSGFTPAYDDVRELELAGPVFPGGAFGDVYDLVAVNGAPPPSRQIVKVLRDNGQGSDQKGFETIEKLQRRIVEVNQHRAASFRTPLQDLPALRALPQFSFRGRMSNMPVYGYSADRLDTAGYLPFAAFLDVDEDPRPRERYVHELGMDDRLLLAHELAEGFDALRELWYIHGDLNPPNLFVNVDECHVAIIDFDSGAVTDAPDESPTTFGKLTEGEWLAPEIMEQMLKNRTQRATVQVTQFTDNWAVAVGIHYLLFLCGPFFLLDRPSTRNIRDYAARHGWPRHDPADPLFAPGMDAAYAVFTDLVLQVPAEVIRRMRDAMTVGVDSPDRRPTYYQWTAALKTAQTPLGIPVFRVVPASTVAGRPVRLEWEVTGARRVSIDQGIGDVDEAGGVEVFPAQSQGWTLTAEGRGGAPVTATASVAVWPVPVVRSVFVPAPDLRHTVVLRNVGIAAPRISLPAPHVSIPAPRIELAAPTLRMPLNLDLSVRLGDDRPGAFPGNLVARPLPAPTARAWPRRDWVPRIGDTFECLAARVRHELTTRFGKGVP